MATMRCSICEKQFDPEKSTAMPFCSARCKQIDLGRWLKEDYGLPAPPSEDDLERESGEQ
jgi:endogenous inhibitor of DNA gyrase (YacG/DUF329 family)